MALRNTTTGYGAVAKLLHWLIAFGMIGIVVLGMVMHELDPFNGSWLGYTTFQLYQFHKSVGFTLMALVVVRLIWKMSNPTPELPSGMKSWEAFLAKSVHIALYVALIGMPITGWLMVSASPFQIPSSYFGLFNVPHLLGPSEQLEAIFMTLHDLLGKLLIAALVLHVAGALKHHFVEKDDVLKRMLPGN